MADAEFDRTVPFYQEVEGVILAGGFSAEAFRSALKYVPRDDDLFIATYPKCGTTWMQQIVYMIFNKGKQCEDLSDVFLRTPFLEMFGIESAEKMPRPGAIKVHLPFHKTPYSEKAKYIYVARNPKDVCVSYYHHMITDAIFTFQEGTFDRYFEDFISGHMCFNDYFDSVLGWYEHRNDPNILFITFEEMKKDTRSIVLKVAKFIGDEWFDMLQSNEEILEDVLKYSRFDFMKDFYDLTAMVSNKDSFDSKSYPGFKHAREFSAKHRKETDQVFSLVRKGKVGSWRDVLSEDQIARLDARIEEKLKDTELYTYWKSIGCI